MKKKPLVYLNESIKIKQQHICLCMLINMSVSIHKNEYEKNGSGWVAHLFGVSSPTPKGCGFNYRSGHIPRLQIRSLVGAHTGGGQIDVFLSY